MAEAETYGYAIIEALYGKDMAKKQMPLHVSEEGGGWAIKGSKPLQPLRLGPITIKLNRDGTIRHPVLFAIGPEGAGPDQAASTAHPDEPLPPRPDDLEVLDFDLPPYPDNFLMALETYLRAAERKGWHARQIVDASDDEKYARSLILAAYGPEQLADQLPLHAKQESDGWRIDGSKALQPRKPLKVGAGLGAMTILANRDGTVRNVYWIMAPSTTSTRTGIDEHILDC